MGKEKARPLGKAMKHRRWKYDLQIRNLNEECDISNSNSDDDLTDDDLDFKWEERPLPEFDIALCLEKALEGSNDKKKENKHRCQYGASKSIEMYRPKNQTQFMNNEKRQLIDLVSDRAMRPIRSQSLKSLITQNIRIDTETIPRMKRSKDDAFAGDNATHLYEAAAATRYKSNDNSILAALSVQQLISSHCPNILPSILGPSPRAATVIFSQIHEVAFLVLWKAVLPVSSNHERKARIDEVVPIVVNEGFDAKWSTICNKIERKINHKLQEEMRLESQSLLCTYDYSRYIKISQYIAAKRQEFTQLADVILANHLSMCRQPSRNQQLIRRAMKSLKIPLHHSKNRFELLSAWVDHHYHQESLNTTYHQISKDWIITEKAEGEQDSIMCNASLNSCIVCFDEVVSTKGCGKVSQVLPCGHRTCLGCWKRYLRSAADSGQGSIRCPGIQCKKSINIIDAAHILFNNDNNDGTDVKFDSNHEIEPSIENQKIFDQLVAYELENHVTCQMNGRFCSTPRCGNFLTVDNRDDPHKTSPLCGFNILSCSLCGHNSCSKCSDHARSSPAHPGISCEVFAQIQKAVSSSQQESELANLEWVIKNTRPCPKCKYPIQKNGGCNHVLCQKCKECFCYQCGGPGNECMAFLCKKTQKYWNHEPDYDKSNYSDLYSYVDQCQKYRKLEKILTSYQRKKARCNSNNEKKQIDFLTMKYELEQVMLWLHALALGCKIQEKNMAATRKVRSLDQTLKHHIERVQTFISAIWIRSQMKQVVKSNDSPAKFDGMMKTISSDPALAYLLEQHQGKSNKCSRKVKQQAWKRLSQIRKTKQLQWSGNILDSIVAQYELEILCKMDENEFIRGAYDATRSAMNFLTTNPTGSVSPPFKKVTTQKSVAERVQQNERVARKRELWKNGMRRVDSSNQSSCCEIQRSSKMEHRWKKDKKRVSTRRVHALDVSDQCIGYMR